MDEIARRSGVTPPVVYDHFDSKLDLHRRLLERTRDELLAMWREQLAGDEPAEERVPRALDAWARYVEEPPLRRPHVLPGDDRRSGGARRSTRRFRPRPARRWARSCSAPSRARATSPAPTEQALEMAAEVIRAGLTGLAIWWIDHPDVPRERIVETAINAIWIGFERVRSGERWTA